MQVQSLECQLTQAQLKRYLAGQPMPEELLDQLERHLQSCPDCLGEAKRMRGQMGGGEAVADESKSSPMAAVMQQVRRAVERPTPATLLDPPGTDGMPPNLLEILKQPRNLVLSVALAIVLVLMSTVFRDPTGLLGARATAMAASEKVVEDEPEEKAAVVKDSDAKESPKEPDPKTEQAGSVHEARREADRYPADSKSIDKKPAQKESETSAKPPLEHPPIGGKILVADSAHRVASKAPKPTVATPKAAPVRKKPVRRPAAKPRTNHIRVYDESGRPKNPTP
ncbi:MAG: zf-HC2 domain-containing protein [Fimbriimonadaceae bacterium]|nr:zf-HC2 domain-containing protein [Fimbriimonadaceae bacterium]QYK58352.1 MAG: zf-HC2 domain-containing protein [Fimbriimonadaceae bacterium]